MLSIVLPILRLVLPIIPTILKAFGVGEEKRGAVNLKKLVPIAVGYVKRAELGDVSGEEKRKAVFTDLQRDLIPFDLRPSDINLLIEMAVAAMKSGQ